MAKNSRRGHNHQDARQPIVDQLGGVWYIRPMAKMPSFTYQDRQAKIAAFHAAWEVASQNIASIDPLWVDRELASISTRRSLQKTKLANQVAKSVVSLLDHLNAPHQSLYDTLVVALRHGADANMSWTESPKGFRSRKKKNKAHKFQIGSPLVRVCSLLSEVIRRGPDSPLSAQMIDMIRAKGAKKFEVGMSDYVEKSILAGKVRLTEHLVRAGFLGRRISLLQSALYLALDVRKIEVVDLLIEFGADLKKKSKHGETALSSIASSSQNKPDTFIRMLLERGADPNALYSETLPSWVAYLASPNAHVLPLLIEYGAQYDPKSKIFPFHRVAIRADIELGEDKLETLIDLLLEMGVCPDEKDVKGECAVEEAINQNKPEVARIMGQRFAAWKASALSVATQDAVNQEAPCPARL